MEEVDPWNFFPQVRNSFFVTGWTWKVFTCHHCSPVSHTVPKYAKPQRHPYRLWRPSCLLRSGYLGLFPRELSGRSVKLFIYFHILTNLRICAVCFHYISTRYRLDGPRIEPRFGRYLLHPSRPTLGPTQLPAQWVPGLFPRGKAAGSWCWLHTPI